MYVVDLVKLAQTMATIIPVKPATGQHSSNQQQEISSMSNASIPSDIFIVGKKSYKLWLSEGKLVWERHKIENGKGKFGSTSNKR